MWYYGLENKGNDGFAGFIFIVINIMGTKRFEKYAPVIIPTLCRFEHFKRCVDSLSRCTGAEYTDLYIGLDYPAKDSHWLGYNKICEYVTQITGFKQVIVLKREKNMGAMANYKDLIENLKGYYDRYISSADDNEFSPNFLEYINAGLDRYKDDPKVLYICGNMMPWAVDFNYYMGEWGKNAFPASDYNAMGLGHWFDKEPEVPFTKESVLKSWKITYKAFRSGYCTSISRMMKQLNKESQLPDVCLRLYCAFNNLYCIFPTISKVKNWGYDGTGINSDDDPRWIDVQILDTAKEFAFDDFEIKDYPEVTSFVKHMYDRKVSIKLIIMLCYVLYRITGVNSIFNKLERMMKNKK